MIELIVFFDCIITIHGLSFLGRVSHQSVTWLLKSEFEKRSISMGFLWPGISATAVPPTQLNEAKF
jgi:hypothetical protein